MSIELQIALFLLIALETDVEVFKMSVDHSKDYNGAVTVLTA